MSYSKASDASDEHPEAEPFPGYPTSQQHRGLARAGVI